MLQNFCDSLLFSELKRLAEKPFDLSAKGALTDKRIETYRANAVGFELSYATERVNEDVLQLLKALAEERRVFESMERMQAGDVINCIEGYASENRAVLHTSLRDFFDNCQTAKPAREAARLAKNEIDKLQPFLNENQGRFKTLIVIGIGGSELGPKALYLALEAYKLRDKEVKFVGNIDPDDLAKALRGEDLSKTLICIISKSGTTLETCVNEKFARSIFENAGVDPKRNFIAVTGEATPMDDPNNYLAVFHIWDWIGGRYSATSVISGLILGFACGFEIYRRLLEGAHAMDRHALHERDPLSNLPLLAALLGVWNHNFLKIQTTAVIPYSQALWRFTAHLQQLDMESNGKQIDRLGAEVNFETGPIVWGEAGTNAQHSFFQLIHQGKIPIALEFIGFKKPQMGIDFEYDGTTSQQKLLANLFAQAISLAQGQKNTNPNKVFHGNQPSFILLGETLDAFALGALLAFYEHKVAFQGFIWNINSFDQEGVQLGKVLANRILELMKQKSSEESFPEGAAYLRGLL